jgi:uncharacterized protein YbjT (DUF2867 family)
MKIAILGASGRTGIHFVRQALERGYSVTALTRSPEKLALENPNLSVIVGDVLNTQDVARTVRGQDAVFIALGTGEAPIKSTIRTDGTQRVVDALRASGEKPHVVILSSLGVGDSQKQLPFYFRPVLNFMYRHVFADHTRQEAIIRASPLPWAILRPTSLNDHAAVGDLQATEAPHSVKALASIARADVAAFALRIIEKQGAYPRTVALTAAAG